MPAAKTVQNPPPPRGEERRQLCDVISRNVLRLLGEPKFDHRVDVRVLWDGHYRVNILVGGELGSLRIVHSYFLAADGEGNIQESTPRIVKKY